MPRASGLMTEMRKSAMVGRLQLQHAGPKMGTPWMNRIWTTEELNPPLGADGNVVPQAEAGNAVSCDRTPPPQGIEDARQRGAAAVDNVSRTSRGAGDGG